ncbi:hypothetical protein TNCV_1618221 [Trichonephila clavipes]|nr:hypothetical protein TNCV_1618221 [Trichonephila clavipes]
MEAIFFDSRIPLVVISDTLTAQGYFDDILQHVKLLFLLNNQDLLFGMIMSYRIRNVAMNYFQVCSTFPWSARSPGFFPLNTFETLWEGDYNHLGTLTISPNSWR